MALVNRRIDVAVNDVFEGYWCLRWSHEFFHLSLLFICAKGLRLARPPQAIRLGGWCPLHEVFCVTYFDGIERLLDLGKISSSVGETASPERLIRLVMLWGVLAVLVQEIVRKSHLRLKMVQV